MPQWNKNIKKKYKNGVKLLFCLDYYFYRRLPHGHEFIFQIIDELKTSSRIETFLSTHEIFCFNEWKSPFTRTIWFFRKWNWSRFLKKIRVLLVEKKKNRNCDIVLTIIIERACSKIERKIFVYRRFIERVLKTLICICPISWHLTGSRSRKKVSQNDINGRCSY